MLPEVRRNQYQEASRALTRQLLFICPFARENGFIKILLTETFNQA